MGGLYCVDTEKQRKEVINYPEWKPIDAVSILKPGSGYEPVATIEKILFLEERLNISAAKVFEETFQDKFQGFNFFYENQTKCYYMREDGKMITSYAIYKCANKYLQLANSGDNSRSYINCIVALLSQSHFVVGCYFEGHLVAYQTFHRYSVRKAGKSKGNKNEPELKIEIREQIKKWSPYTDKISVIYTQCSEKNIPLIKQLVEHEVPIEQLPFRDIKPNLDELKLVYQNLTSAFPTGDPFYQYPLWRNLPKSPRVEELVVIEKKSESYSKVSETKAERQSEKQNFPTLTQEFKNDLRSAIDNNDYDMLMDLFEAGSSKNDMVNYLSAILPKLNQQSFFHLAVKQDKIRAVEALLEMEVDPSVQDGNNKVPYEYAKSEKMRGVFKDFRNGNPSLHNWTKCQVPNASMNHEDRRSTRKWDEERNSQKKRVKEQRKEQRESKRILFT